MRKFRSFTSNNGGFSGDLPTVAGCFTSCFQAMGNSLGTPLGAQWFSWELTQHLVIFLAEIHGENRTYAEVIAMSLRPRY